MAIAAGYRGGKAVSPANYGFDKTGLLGVVPERSANLADRHVDAVVDINENVLAPKALSDLLAGYQFPGPFDQKDKQVHGKFLQPQQAVTPAQLVARLIQREIGEMKFLGRKNPRRAPGGGC